MIISRTPYRISFFGGSTDYPAFYMKYGGGAVISTTINKYCYVTCRDLPRYFDVSNKFVWSKVELTNSYDEVEHPVIREGLRMLGFDKNPCLEIHHQGDLPARSGMATSSAFAVGLLAALYAYKDLAFTPKVLAMQAVHLERHRLKENVGDQDQYACAYGGFNYITFGANTGVQRISCTSRQIRVLESNLMLFHIGGERIASNIAKDVIANIHDRAEILQEMRGLTAEAFSALINDRLDEFGRLLHETWTLKRQTSSIVSNPTIDSIYERAKSAGALGGKLLGAGAGGFMLFYVPVRYQADIVQELKDYKYVPFNFENKGTVTWKLS